jgi:hypothetical protein
MLRGAVTIDYEGFFKHRLDALRRGAVPGLRRSRATAGQVTAETHRQNRAVNGATARGLKPATQRGSENMKRAS